MAKSDSRFEYKANLSRTDHNLSQPYGFTTTSGMLLPIWYDLATPGDSYYMQHDLPLLRSIQLVAPSMVDVKVHYETFFVPLQMLYQPSENVLFSLKNTQSNFYNQISLQNNNFPVLNYSTMCNDIVTNSNLQDLRADAYRLTDLLGLCPFNFASGISMAAYAPSFFPYQLLAYHTIFNYYYRLDDKTQFDHSICNWDSFYQSGNPVVSNVYEILQIHQRPWDFDYFMSMYRSPIVSDANMQSILPSSKYSDFIKDNSYASVFQTTPVNNVNSTTSSNDSIRGFNSIVNLGSEALGSVATMTPLIRQMFANEKLAMISGRTRKNYDSQVLAHYGVNVPHDVKHDLTMIHHDEYDLSVQEVTSLASTSDAPLGELAGKSYSAGHGKEFKFTAPCHGVIMTIFSIEPKKRYVTNFDRINAITNAYDLPTPEFDRLGNVPMFRYECGVARYSPLPLTDIVGWKERYYQFKRKPAKVTTAFVSNNGLNNYSSYFLACYPFGEASLTGTGQQLAIDASPRPDYESRFYIERGAFDNMCQMPFYVGWKTPAEGEEGENWNLTPWLLYARDPFIVNSHIKCKKVSWMSKDGEPVYNF